MLAWLVVEADLSNVVHLHLVHALVDWAPMMGEHLFLTEPEAGVDTDPRKVLEEAWWRLEVQAAEARWADEVVLHEVRGRVGLAIQALGAGPAPLGLTEPRSPGG